MVLSRLFDLNLEYSIKGNIYDEFKCGVVRLNHDGLTVLSVERMLRKLVEHNHQQYAKNNMGDESLELSRGQGSSLTHQQLHLPQPTNVVAVVS